MDPHPDEKPIPASEPPASPTSSAACEDAVPVAAAPALSSTSTPAAEPEDEETQAPTITTLYRLPRDRRPDTTDQSLWKLACQERVEYLCVFRSFSFLLFPYLLSLLPSSRSYACGAVPSVGIPTGAVKRKVHGRVMEYIYAHPPQQPQPHNCPDGR